MCGPDWTNPGFPGSSLFHGRSSEVAPTLRGATTPPCLENRAAAQQSCRPWRGWMTVWWQLIDERIDRRSPHLPWSARRCLAGEGQMFLMVSTNYFSPINLNSLAKKPITDFMPRPGSETVSGILDCHVAMCNLACLSALYTHTEVLQAC